MYTYISGITQAAQILLPSTTCTGHVALNECFSIPEFTSSSSMELGLRLSELNNLFSYLSLGGLSIRFPN